MKTRVMVLRGNGFICSAKCQEIIISQMKLFPPCLNDRRRFFPNPGFEFSSWRKASWRNHPPEEDMSIPRECILVSINTSVSLLLTNIGPILPFPPASCRRILSKSLNPRCDLADPAVRERRCQHRSSIASPIAPQSPTAPRSHPRLPAFPTDPSLAVVPFSSDCTASPAPIRLLQAPILLLRRSSAYSSPIRPTPPFLMQPSPHPRTRDSITR
ncbi:hypothetical protein KSP39_PZI000055 [Platanthera zijinensis]|uniref:Uncharacterized protein n=1 Tax=Platanthera zijinensis TaxID=2320716 RepID=A0AAP0C5M0_9ASPA